MDQVRIGGMYIYRPTGIDKFYPKSNVEPGNFVRVTSLPNGSGACHITTMEGQFAGLVGLESLISITWEKKGEKRWPEREPTANDDGAIEYTPPRARTNKRSVRRA